MGLSVAAKFAHSSILPHCYQSLKELGYKCIIKYSHFLWLTEFETMKDEPAAIICNWKVYWEYAETEELFL